MSAKWPLVSLGELLRLERRPVVLKDEEKYQEIGIYCFGKGIFHKQPRTGFEVGDKDLFALKKDDFILQITFAWEGAVAVVSEKEEGMYGSTRYPTFRVDEQRCLPHFLQLYFRTEEGRNQLVKISPGSAGRNRVLSLKRIPEVMVPLPPLAEQRRLVARIEAVAALVAEAQALRKEAVMEAEALWAQTAKVIFAKVEAGNSTVQLRDLVVVRGGGTPSKANPFYWVGAIPWVTPKDMKVRELHDAIDHISEEATRSSSAKPLAPGAVLVVVRGMILAHTVPTAVLRVPATVNQDMKALVPNDRVLPEYLCSILWARNSDVLALVEKSTHDTRKLQTEPLLNFPVPLPDLPTQRRIVRELDALQAQVDALKALQAVTQAELDGLMGAVLGEVFGQGGANYQEPAGELRLAAEP